jgi:hypothetical protein
MSNHSDSAARLNLSYPSDSDVNTFADTILPNPCRTRVFDRDTYLLCLSALYVYILSQHPSMT